jgi:hypothetical protein
MTGSGLTNILGGLSVQDAEELETLVIGAGPVSDELWACFPEWSGGTEFKMMI